MLLFVRHYPLACRGVLRRSRSALCTPLCHDQLRVRAAAFGTAADACSQEIRAKWRECTRAVHAGEYPDPNTKASAPGIEMSSTFVVDQPLSFSVYGTPDDAPYIYTRWANPTVQKLEEKLVSLERGANACAVFASGMAAASAIFFSRLSSGDHLIIADVSYAGVAELVRETLPRFGIEVSFVDASNVSNVAMAVKANTKMIWMETPANPILRLVDVRACAEISQACGAELVVDSTFASPVLASPLNLGADFVVHSLTKYISGHGDCMGGAVLATDATKVKHMVGEASVHYGASLSPFNAWLTMRGCATLPLRMRAHSTTAIAVAEFLESHSGVKQVRYPGLPSHPQHDIAVKQMRDGLFSGMMQFQVQGGAVGGRQVAQRMMDKLSVIHYAVSLGHTRSLIYYMSTEDLLSSSFQLEGQGLEAYRESAGDGIFRFSVGLEDKEDLIEDLMQVLPSVS